MLKMRAQAAIHGDGCPFVVEQPRVRPADIHHGLDREYHAFAEARTVSPRSVIGNLRLFVQPGPDSVSYELTDYAEAIGFDHFLHARADIAYRAANARRLNRALQRSLRYVEQLLDLRLQMVPNRNRHGRICIVAVEHHTAVDRNDVAFLQHALGGWNAVHDLLIHRGAEHARVIVITLERRFGPKLLDLGSCNGLQIHRADAGLYSRHGGVEHLPNDAPTAAHLLNLSRGLAHDGHQATLSKNTGFRIGSFPRRRTASEPLAVR